MLIDVAVLACGLLCAAAQWECAFKSRCSAHTSCVLERVSDPVFCSLACGYLEVRADVVSACGSGFTISSLIESCIHLADSQREKFLSPFYLFLFVHQELLQILVTFKNEKLCILHMWGAHFYCERARNKTLHFPVDLPCAEVAVFNPRIDCCYHFDLCYFMDPGFSLSSMGSGMSTPWWTEHFSLMNFFLLLSWFS